MRWDDVFEIAVPGYLTGIGTLALAAVTVKTLREAQTERQDRLNFELRAEARRVILDEPRQNGTGETPGAPSYRRCDVVCRVTNGASEPVLDVTVAVTAEPPDYLLTPDAATQTGHLARLMPGDNGWLAHVNFDVEHDATAHLGSATKPVVYVAALTFTDSAGYRWRRNVDHRLVPLGPAEPTRTAPLSRRSRR